MTNQRGNRTPEVPSAASVAFTAVAAVVVFLVALWMLWGAESMREAVGTILALFLSLVLVGQAQHRAVVRRWAQDVTRPEDEDR